MNTPLTAKEIRSIIAERAPADSVIAEHTRDEHFYRYKKTGLVYPSVTTQADILDSPHLKRWAASQAVKHIDKNWNKINEDNKEQIFKSAVFAHQRQFEEAGDVGTRGHDVVDRYLQRWIELGSRPTNIKNYILGEDSRIFAISRAAEKFCKDFDIIPIASELRVASAKYQFAGTLDSLMMVARPTNKGDKDCQHEWMGTSTLDWRRHGCFKCPAKKIYEFCLVDWKTSNSIVKDGYAMQTSAYWQALYEMTGLRTKHILIVRLDKGFDKYQVMKVAHRPSAFAAYKNIIKVYKWLNDGNEKVAPLKAKERINLID